ncbi:hypothetical protein D9M68_690570 [compost metagenome]
MTLAERLKLIRKREGLTQAAFCEAIGMSISTYKKYELGLRKEVSVLGLLKVTNHPRFMKYTLWLMTGASGLASRQISPE